MADLANNNAKENLKSRLIDKLGLTGNNRDSVVSILAEVIGSEIENVKNEIYANFEDTQIENLSGEALEEKAFNTYGITRIPSRKAFSRDVMFYASGGTFGSINGGVDIVVPAGTRIGINAAISNQDIVFVTMEDVTLFANTSNKMVRVEALFPGTNYNVRKDSLVYCDFETYAGFSEGLLKVTNRADISNGADEESDFSLRLRAVNFLSENSNRNRESLFLAGLRETEVFYFEIIESYFGIGTIGVIVKGHGLSRVSVDVINSIRSRLIPGLRVLGQSVHVVNAKNVILNISLQGKFLESLGDSEITARKNEIRSQLIDLIKSMEYTKNLDFYGLSQSLIRDFNLRPPNGAQTIFSEITKEVNEDDETGSTVSSYDEDDNGYDDIVINNDECIGGISIILEGLSR